ncbi:MAG: hypothetical protein ACD_68C00004G0002 [uncultured bacterium]|nr:MAG: hypothetical protein ACD_68C00004G0002 [uncultured bacterium]
MTKVATKTVFVCSVCGADFPKWAGKCEACGEWNSLKSMSVSTEKTRRSQESALSEPRSFTAITSKHKERLVSGITEFDRTLGGGMVAGSVILLGGDPGIGKSTLTLQICAEICRAHPDKSVLYFSGEESAEQIKLRADRLKINQPNLFFSEITSTEAIAKSVEKAKPVLAIIDSIQTAASERAETAPGSVSQLKESTFAFTETAKKNGITFLLIGHVTKEGVVAGPRLLEHMVDVVLYLEGDRYHNLRILRGIKNRFGSTNESGIFEMLEQGMKEVTNPSGLFLEERKIASPGSTVTAYLEGSRPFLVEIQALSSRTVFGYPKRTASGLDLNRLHLLLAVLSRQTGAGAESYDIYVNAVGGMKIAEPALDLAILTACASSLKQKCVLEQTVVFGEVGLAGEVRGVSQVEKRAAECVKLGFQKIIVPQSNFSALNKFAAKIKIVPVAFVKEAIAAALVK